MASEHVDEQVERILDTDERQRLDVVVRVASPDDERALVGSIVEALRRRAMASSTRDLLPPPAGARGRGGAAADARVGSVAEQVAAAPAAATGVEQLRAQALEALQPLMPSGRRAPEAEGAATSVFWTSRSVRLVLGRDDLAALPERVPSVADVYPNRRLRVPRVVEVRDLPRTVLENRASAWGVAAIGALATWGAYGARGDGTTVAVLDTGIDAEHPDLTGKVVDWAEFDAAGQQVPDSQPHDTDRHGTHVAGTIAGGSASGQWIGVAPDARIAAALVLDGAVGGTDAQVLAGIDWAVERGVDAINMSLGGLTLGPEVPATYSQAIVSCLRAGIPVVTAIGNDGDQVTGSPGNDLFAFAVGATDHRDLTAGFSGGRTQVVTDSSIIPPEHLPLVYSKPDVSAPGVGVLSSVPGGEWAAFNGTSMATPHVAGAVALLLSATRIRDAVDGAERAFLVQDLLTGSVEELGETGQDHRYGLGRIDVLRTVGLARERGF